jgi:chromate transport protein ChrA
MWELLFWVYVVNAVFLINHEVDSAYWKEWNLMGLPGGITLFLLIHFPLFFLIIYGAVLLDRGASSGLIYSLVLGLVGIIAFSLHTYFIKKGRDEFKTPMSQFILISTLIISVAQLGMTIYLLIL